MILKNNIIDNSRVIIIIYNGIYIKTKNGMSRVL